MDFSRMPYAHLLRFQCKWCDQAIIVPVRSEAASLEKVDGYSYHVECQCGWAANLLGVEADRHWVTPWHDQQNIVKHLKGAGNARLSNLS
jgi:hypothetical protein